MAFSACSQRQPYKVYSCPKKVNCSNIDRVEINRDMKVAIRQLIKYAITPSSVTPVLC